MQIKLEDIAGYYLRLEGNRLICPDCFKARYGGEVDLDMILDLPPFNVPPLK